MPQYESASLHWPEASWLICNQIVWRFAYCLTVDTYAIVVNVRDHNEQLTVETFGVPFRYQEVVGPSATAEIKLGQLCPTLGTGSVQIPVSSLERNGHWRVHRVASDRVLSLFHLKCFMGVKSGATKLELIRLRLTLNRSNSMNISLWSLNSHGLPLSSNLGARKILQVPSLAALLCTPIR